MREGWSRGTTSLAALWGTDHRDKSGCGCSSKESTKIIQTVMVTDGLVRVVALEVEQWLHSTQQDLPMTWFTRHWKSAE